MSWIMTEMMEMMTSQCREHCHCWPHLRKQMLASSHQQQQHNTAAVKQAVAAVGMGSSSGHV
jgi:hypothetical protein